MLALLSIAAQMVIGARSSLAFSELGSEALKRAMIFTTLAVAETFMQSPKTSKDKEWGEGFPPRLSIEGLFPPPIFLVYKYECKFYKLKSAV